MLGAMYLSLKIAKGGPYPIFFSVSNYTLLKSFMLVSQFAQFDLKSDLTALSHTKIGEVTPTIYSVHTSLVCQDNSSILDSINLQNH